MRRLLSVPPLAIIIPMLALASAGMLVVLQDATPQTVFVAPTTSAPSNPVDSSTPPPITEPPPLPSCLSPLATHYYSEHPKNAAKAGPGSRYKESRNAMGPSAVPLLWNDIDPIRRFEEVKQEFVRRHCGDGVDGGDKKLFQVGYVSLDVKHLARAATHPEMNPNIDISRQLWEERLAVYLGAIRWDLSYLTYEKLGPSVWTLTMVHRDGKEPLVRAIRHEQPKSHYLNLAITQPDGSIFYERRRLECGFQTTWTAYEDVPAAYNLPRTYAATGRADMPHMAVSAALGPHLTHSCAFFCLPEIGILWIYGPHKTHLCCPWPFIT